MHLRGLAMTPVKFGIAFTSKFLNQANALVNVYSDGTVQVSTGGTEMGQGLNTKIRQMVADELGVPYPDVIIMPTSTEKNNNTSPTAASAGTDLNGAAAVKACRKIRRRLAEYAAAEYSHPIPQAWLHRRSTLSSPMACETAELLADRSFEFVRQTVRAGPPGSD